MDLGPAATAPAGPGDTLPENRWLQPIPDGRVLPADDDPAEVAVARESIRLAFVAALQELPPRQRAVLILREVLHWKADEVATLLDTTTASVNSALQRARATLAASDLADAEAPTFDDAQQELVDRYVDAFERYDIDSLVALLHEDATMSMPPYALWLRGPAEIARWHLGPGAPLPGIEADPDPGERRSGVRAVPAERSRRVEAVGAPGPRGLRRSHRRAQRLPRHRHPVPAVRAAAPAVELSRS